MTDHKCCPCTKPLWDLILAVLGEAGRGSFLTLKRRLNDVLYSYLRHLDCSPETHRGFPQPSPPAGGEGNRPCEEDPSGQTKSGS